MTDEQKVDGIFVSPEYLRELFMYENGRLYWKARNECHFVSEKASKIWNAKFPGKEVGYELKGYRRVRFLGRLWSVHAVIYALHHGPFTGIIDHIDGNTLNNNLANLRLTDRLGNSRNRSVNARIQSGLKGAYPSGSKWFSTIRIDGKPHYLGLFDTAELAHAAYAKAARKHFGEFANYER